MCGFQALVNDFRLVEVAMVRVVDAGVRSMGGRVGIVVRRMKDKGAFWWKYIPREKILEEDVVF